MINGDREIQCHQHKTMIYGDKENSIISIKKIIKLFEELKLRWEEADPEFAASSAQVCCIHVCPWFVLALFCVPSMGDRPVGRHSTIPRDGGFLSHPRRWL